MLWNCRRHQQGKFCIETTVRMNLECSQHQAANAWSYDAGEARERCPMKVKQWCLQRNICLRRPVRKNMQSCLIAVQLISDSFLFCMFCNASLNIMSLGSLCVIFVCVLSIVRLGSVLCIIDASIPFSFISLRSCSKSSVYDGAAVDAVAVVLGDGWRRNVKVLARHGLRVICVLASMFRPIQCFNCVFFLFLNIDPESLLNF